MVNFLVLSIFALTLREISLPPRRRNKNTHPILRQRLIEQNQRGLWKYMSSFVPNYNRLNFFSQGNTSDNQGEQRYFNRLLGVMYPIISWPIYYIDKLSLNIYKFLKEKHLNSIAQRLMYGNKKPNEENSGYLSSFASIMNPMNMIQKVWSSRSRNVYSEEIKRKEMLYEKALKESRLIWNFATDLFDYDDLNDEFDYKKMNNVVIMTYEMSSCIVKIFPNGFPEELNMNEYLKTANWIKDMPIMKKNPQEKLIIQKYLRDNFHENKRFSPNYRISQDQFVRTIGDEDRRRKKRRNQKNE